MTPDDFTEAARKRAEQIVPLDGGEPNLIFRDRRELVEMAEWARTHLAAQEPTDAEVEAAAKAQYRNPDGWDLVLAAYRKRVAEVGPIPSHVIAHRLELARAALSAARAARRDEEKR